MIYSKAFKKLAALTAAIALVGSFAVSASAATVTTTTSYVAGDTTKVAVNVTVSKVAANSEVTYYATNDAGVFHLDQATANEEGAATFTQYVTDAANLKANVKVGNTSAAAVDSTVDAKTVKIGESVVATIPTEATDALITVSYSVAAGKAVTGATATGAEVESVVAANEAGKYTVALSSITGDVVLTMTEKDSISDASMEFLASGFVYDEASDRVITVIGKVANLTEKYGALINGAKYEAIHANTLSKGSFVVQLIDETDDGKYIPLSGAVSTGVYYEDGLDTITGNGTDVTVTAQ